MITPKHTGFVAGPDGNWADVIDSRIDGKVIGSVLKTKVKGLAYYEARDLYGNTVYAGHDLLDGYAELAKAAEPKSR